MREGKNIEVIKEGAWMGKMAGTLFALFSLALSPTAFASPRYTTTPQYYMQPRYHD